LCHSEATELSSRRIRGTSCRPEDTSPKDLRDPSLIAQGDKKITQGDTNVKFEN